MERFKILEKETKTKAYSKEGLNQSMKRSSLNSGHTAEHKADPRYESYQWIDQTRRELKHICAELSKLVEKQKAVCGCITSCSCHNVYVLAMRHLPHLSRSSRPLPSLFCIVQAKGKKPVGVASETSNRLQRHEWHLKQLKKLKQALANEEATIDQVESIKDDVEYYINSNQV